MIVELMDGYKDDPKDQEIARLKRELETAKKAYSDLILAFESLTKERDELREKLKLIQGSGMTK